MVVVVVGLRVVDMAVMAGMVVEEAAVVVHGEIQEGVGGHVQEVMNEEVVVGEIPENIQSLLADQFLAASHAQSQGLLQGQGPKTVERPLQGGAQVQKTEVGHASQMDAKPVVATVTVKVNWKCGIELFYPTADVFPAVTLQFLKVMNLVRHTHAYIHFGWYVLMTRLCKQVFSFFLIIIQD